jgi:hypothetical protein
VRPGLYTHLKSLSLQQTNVESLTPAAVDIFVIYWLMSYDSGVHIGVII